MQSTQQVIEAIPEIPKERRTRRGKGKKFRKVTIGTPMTTKFVGSTGALKHHNYDLTYNMGD